MRGEVPYDMLHANFPRLQPYTLSGGCALGRINTGLRWDGGPCQALHPTASNSAPMIPHGLINEEQVLSPEETRWDVRCHLMESDCPSRSC